MSGTYFNAHPETTIFGTHVIMTNSTHNPVGVSIFPSQYSYPRDVTAGKEIMASHNFSVHLVSGRHVGDSSHNIFSEVCMEPPSKAWCLNCGISYEGLMKVWSSHRPVSQLIHIGDVDASDGQSQQCVRKHLTTFKWPSVTLRPLA